MSGNPAFSCLEAKRPLCATIGWLMGTDDHDETTNTTASPDLGSAKAVAKTMAVLEFLAQHRDAHLADICRQTGMHKSTGYRFLTALRQLGYVRQEEDGAYATTMKLAQLGMLVTDAIDLVKDARPIVEELAAETEETVHLATIEELRLVYVDKVESTKGLRVAMRSRVGSSAPTYCTGLGKALLAFLPPEVRDQVLAQEELIRHTANTITERTRLDDELAQVRARGTAFDNEEHELGVRCVAAPILDKGGRAVAALSISAPSVRLRDEQLPAYRRLVADAAARLAARVSH